jgi:hypothetical protein
MKLCARRNAEGNKESSPRSINRLARVLLSIALVLATAHRLPAPIVEETTPQPTPAIKPKVAVRSSPATKSVPVAETGMSSRSVQVVVTENTKAALAYLRSAGKSDVRPDEIMEQLRQTLSTRFSSVSILNGSLPSRNGGLTMLFDLQAHVGSISFTSNTVSFVATFKDNTGRTIQTISASGSSTVPYPNFKTQFPKAVSKAFADFSQKLNALQ